MATTYSGPSVVDYLASVGQPTDFASRAKLAQAKGITNYAGTAAQNTQLLNTLKSEKTVTAPTPTSTPVVTAPPVPGATATTAPGVAATTVTPPLITQRDTAREAAMTKKMGITPSTPLQQELLLRATYTPAELKSMGLYQDGKQIPQEKQVFNPALLKQMGMSDAQIATLQPQGFQVNQAQQMEGDTYKPTNMGIRVLEDALRARGDVGNQDIGTSKIFEQAGLSGMGALGASLQARQTEMAATYDDFLSGVTRVSDALKDQYATAAEIYKTNKDLFDTTIKSLMEYNQKAQDAKDAISLLEKKHTLQMEETEFAARMAAKYRAPTGGSGAGGDDAKRAQITQGLALAAASNSYGEVSPEDYNAAKQQYLDQKLGTAADFETAYGHYVTNGRPTAKNNAEYNTSR